jgi:BirA family biotin operon repressor/biotin-[acetyl-CoA-carboxylase] ligase
VLDNVTSTNTYAMQLVQVNVAVHGDAIFARHQTAGKGQRGKQWTDEPDTAIALSVIVDTTALPAHKPFLLSMAAALAGNDFFTRYAGPDTRIKWPNDIYWNDRKAGGILIENLITSGQFDKSGWKRSVIGIGININQTAFDAALRNPVSLKQITGKDFDTIALAKELCLYLQVRFVQLLNGQENALLAEYNQQLYRKNQLVRLKKASSVFLCKVKQVNIYGELQVSDAMQESFSFGEVEWVLGEP